VLADVGSNNLTMSRVGMREDVLDEVVTILITGNVDQWDSSPIMTTLANTVKVVT
jgi:hypothetical protein